MFLPPFGAVLGDSDLLYAGERIKASSSRLTSGVCNFEDWPTVECSVVVVAGLAGAAAQEALRGRLDTARVNCAVDGRTHAHRDVLAGCRQAQAQKRKAGWGPCLDGAGDVQRPAPVALTCFWSPHKTHPPPRSLAWTSCLRRPAEMKSARAGRARRARASSSSQARRAARRQRVAPYFLFAEGQADGGVSGEGSTRTHLLTAIAIHSLLGRRSPCWAGTPPQYPTAVPMAR